jgi:outer membrane receptor for ferrienterochelin and colicin
MVSSTDNSTLKILGKNASVIYINGRKSNMDPEAVIEMLKNMPSENISKIEVITMPSSEFQVEGNQGIINIILKKSQQMVQTETSDSKITKGIIIILLDL